MNQCTACEPAASYSVPRAFSFVRDTYWGAGLFIDRGTLRLRSFQNHQSGVGLVALHMCSGQHGIYLKDKNCISNEHSRRRPACLFRNSPKSFDDFEWRNGRFPGASRCRCQRPRRALPRRYVRPELLAARFLKRGVANFGIPAHVAVPEIRPAQRASASLLRGDDADEGVGDTGQILVDMRADSHYARRE